MKTCVLMGTSYVGKTETIKKICEMFEKDATYIEKVDSEDRGDDIVAIYKDNKNNYIIGLISVGDAAYDINEGYKWIKGKEKKLDFLVCASRTKGETKDYVEEKLKKESEEIVTIVKPYFCATEVFIEKNKNSMNLYFAKYIYDNLYNFFN